MLNLADPQLRHRGLRAAAGPQVELALPEDLHHGEPQPRRRRRPRAVGGGGEAAQQVGALSRGEGAQEVPPVQARLGGL